MEGVAARARATAVTGVAAPGKSAAAGGAGGATAGGGAAGLATGEAAAGKAALGTLCVRAAFLAAVWAAALRRGRASASAGTESVQAARIAIPSTRSAMGTASHREVALGWPGRTRITHSGRQGVLWLGSKIRAASGRKRKAAPYLQCEAAYKCGAAPRVSVRSRAAARTRTLAPGLARGAISQADAKTPSTV